MISPHCPICLKKKPRESLLIHLSQHGYDNMQASVLINYNNAYKGLIDHFDLKLPEVDQLDERFLLYNKFLQATYRFFRPLPSEYEKLNIKKSISELINIYREILGCKIYGIKLRLESSKEVTTDIDKYEILVLANIYESLHDYLNELGLVSFKAQGLYPKAIEIGNGYLVNWDHIEFLEGKITVTINEIPINLIFLIPSSQRLLNYIKENYFKIRFKNEQFSIAFINERKVDLRQSTILRVEELIKANSKSIAEILKKAGLKTKTSNDKTDQYIKTILADKSEFAKGKHEYIKLAVGYCCGDDKVYSIKENYNGREEGAIIIEYKRSNHIYILVENENLNRSAHLFSFDKNSTGNVEKVCGFYLSDKENKRGIIKERGIDFKKELDTVFNIKTLYHSDFKKYKDHLLEYLYKIG